jgi:Ca2+-binding RTX toxin-like protein
MGVRMDTARTLAGAACALTLAIAVPTAASAATVQVVEMAGATNQANVEFTAGSGEQNALVASYHARGDGFAELALTDSGSPVSPGAGCTGGGAPGNPVVCTFHAPRGADYEICGRDCFLTKPGTAWAATLVVRLGDGADSLNATSLPGGYPGAVPVTVDGGAGSDQIATGSASDSIVAGPGDDEVHSGDGHDTALASAPEDGTDHYDLGAESFDRLDYRARSAPISLTGDLAGAGGENDVLSGVEFVVGGSGNDVLVSNGNYYALDGGAGNDLLVGGPERDWIYGGAGADRLFGAGGDDEMSGGDGDDAYDGGPGNDSILEWAKEETGDNLSRASALGPPTYGNDIASGGTGNDRIELGHDQDLARGDEGDDWLNGEDGNDQLAGNLGDDRIAGEAGRNRLLGGEGDDELVSGYTTAHFYTGVVPGPVDTLRDSVECGPGRDHAIAGRWDSLERCEDRTLVKAIRVREVAHDRRRGTARLTADFFGTGTIALLGRGGSRVRPTSKAVPGENLRRPVLTVRARGRTRYRLRRRGRIVVRLWLVYEPAHGVARREPARVTLLLRP